MARSTPWKLTSLAQTQRWECRARRRLTWGVVSGQNGLLLIPLDVGRLGKVEGVDSDVFAGHEDGGGGRREGGGGQRVASKGVLEAVEGVVHVLAAKDASLCHKKRVGSVDGQLNDFVVWGGLSEAAGD